jgi:hypothetical protein
MSDSRASHTKYRSINPPDNDSLRSLTGHEPTFVDAAHFAAKQRVRTPIGLRAAERLMGRGSRTNYGIRSDGGVDHDTQRELGSPTHWITSLARNSIDWGTFKPRALAVLRLITSSYSVGCSTGRSAGLAPWRILST